MDKIEEVWIIENSGLCIFSHSLGSVDETLFSGFLTSIQAFLESIGEKKIKRIELGESKLTIYNLDEYNIFLVLRSTQKTKDKYLEKKIKEIRKKFTSRFSNILIKHQVKNLPYNINDFEPFHGDLEEIFKEDIDRNISNWMSKI